MESALPRALSVWGRQNCHMLEVGAGFRQRLKVEARTKAETQRIAAEAGAQSPGAEAVSQAEATGLVAQAAAEAQRLKTAA